METDSRNLYSEWHPNMEMFQRVSDTTEKAGPVAVVPWKFSSQQNRFCNVIQQDFRNAFGKNGWSVVLKSAEGSRMVFDVQDPHSDDGRCVTLIEADETSRKIDALLLSAYPGANFSSFQWKWGNSTVSNTFGSFSTSLPGHQRLRGWIKTYFVALLIVIATLLGCQIVVLHTLYHLFF